MRPDRRYKRRDITPVWAGSLPGRTEVSMDAGRSFMVIRDERGDGGPWMVYVALADDDSVLYVGQTKNGNLRMRQHAGRESWWDEVRRVLWEPQLTRRLAIMREAELIHELSPRYNVYSGG